jgi:hypothetical protein
VPFIKSMQVTDGVIASETTPTTEELYITPSELEATFCCSATEAQLRFVQACINTHCNRASLWPCEYLFERNIPYGRQEVGLPVLPVISVSEAAGRWSYGRRDRIGWQQGLYGYNQILALAAASNPQWSPIDVSAIEINHASGILYLPMTFMLQPFSLVRIRALCGYITIPARCKAAVAEILNTMAAKGVSDRNRYTVGRITRQFTSTTWISQQAADLLSPFVVSEYM